MKIFNLFKDKVKLKKILLIFLIFIYAISLRVWHLNDAGRTWDESWYIDQGYKHINAIRNLNLQDSVWYKNPDQPAFGKYLYGITSLLDVKTIEKGNVIFNYDFAYSRLLSAIIASISAIIIFLIGSRYISDYIGFLAAIIISSLPVFIGLSQLVTLETPLMLFFTLSIYSFLFMLEKINYKRIILTGVIFGIAISVKYTNILILPVFVGIFFFFYKFNENKKINYSSYKSSLLILPVAIITFCLLWPALFLYGKQILDFSLTLRGSQGIFPPPETFFGIFMPVPVIYYIVYFLITTPILLLIAFYFGVKKTIDKKKWIYFAFIVWFLVPFIQSLYNYRQNGIRYIIEIYAPLSLISAIGIDSLLEKFKKPRKLRVIVTIILIVYLLIVIAKISPYYLNYFNELIGGTGFVRNHKLFHIGWWGDGLKEAGVYLENNAPKNSRIGLRLNPNHTMYQSSNLIYLPFQENNEYDYVVVNYYAVIREFFRESILSEKYDIVYSVKADGASIVNIYKHK